MGLVRKTLSISTLGLVNFRSKKELLARAEADLGAATDELDREHRARAAAEARIAVAERRSKAAELQALHAAKKAARLRGKKGKQARTLLDRLNEAAAVAEPKLRDAAEEAGKRGRRAAKKATQGRRGGPGRPPSPSIREAADEAASARRGRQEGLQDGQGPGRQVGKPNDRPPVLEQAWSS